MYENNEIDNIYTLCANQKIQQRKYEWVNFLKILNAKYPIQSALEIGCYDGGSTVGISRFCQNLTTIDANKMRFNRNVISEKCDYEYISDTSFSPSVKEAIYKKYNNLDLLFIDGDHTYEGVKKDYENFSPLVKSGGMIAFHDIVDSEYHRSVNCYVSKYWNEIKQNKNYVELIYDNDNNLYLIDNITHPDVCWGGIGIIFVD
jgi:predicted O-methyltransferase YrrM